MRFEKQTFTKERINLDYNDFDQCRFIECELVFNAVGSVGFTRNAVDGCRWTFEGPAAATASFMKALYGMGADGRKVVLTTLRNIVPDLKIQD